MIAEFKKLKPEEKEQMMQATALISLYAACMDGKIHLNSDVDGITHTSVVIP